MYKAPTTMRSDEGQTDVCCLTQTLQRGSLFLSSNPWPPSHNGATFLSCQACLSDRTN